MSLFDSFSLIYKLQGLIMVVILQLKII